MTGPHTSTTHAPGAPHPPHGRGDTAEPADARGVDEPADAGGVDESAGALADNGSADSAAVRGAARQGTALAPDAPSGAEDGRSSEAHAPPGIVPDPVSEPGYQPREPGEPMHAGPDIRPYRALVVTASNRASAGVYADKGGPLVAEGLARMGFIVDGPRVVPDGDPVEAALHDGVLLAYDVIVTTGGTGVSPTDLTPDVTRRVIDYEIPGIPESIRAEGRPHVPTAALSRGLAGVAGGRTLIVNLPGSTGGVRDGLAVLGRILLHAVDQLRGGDHPRPDATADPHGPTGPADPHGPTGPTDPHGPTGPTDPHGPTGPADPHRPTGPAGPFGSTN